MHIARIEKLVMTMLHLPKSNHCCHRKKNKDGSDLVADFGQSLISVSQTEMPTVAIVAAILH